MLPVLSRDMTYLIVFAKILQIIREIWKEIKVSDWNILMHNKWLGQSFSQALQDPSNKHIYVYSHIGSASNRRMELLLKVINDI